MTDAVDRDLYGWNGPPQSDAGAAAAGAALHADAQVATRPGSRSASSTGDNHVYQVPGDPVQVVNEPGGTIYFNPVGNEYQTATQRYAFQPPLPQSPSFGQEVGSVFAGICTGIGNLIGGILRGCTIGYSSGGYGGNAFNIGYNGGGGLFGSPYYGVNPYAGFYGQNQIPPFYGSNQLVPPFYGANQFSQQQPFYPSYNSLGNSSLGVSPAQAAEFAAFQRWEQQQQQQQQQAQTPLA
jgi:hypothetical protein